MGLAVLLVALSLLGRYALRDASDTSVPAALLTITSQVHEAYGKIPLSFEDNYGQAPEGIDFVARGPGYAVALSPTEAVFALRIGEQEARNEKSVAGVRQVSNLLSEPSPQSALHTSQSTVLRMSLVGGNREAKAEGLKALEGKVNYFIGNNPERWRRNVPTFGQVRYREVYPGIDVVYYGNQRRLEYDFVVAPGSDPRAIALEFAGADGLEIEEATGDLLLRTGGRTMRQYAPVTYQEAAGVRREVKSRYAMLPGSRVGFAVGQYDPHAPLIIDPVLVYSTYLGGANADVAFNISVDSSGNVYVAGTTRSTNFPTTNAVQGTFGGGTFTSGISGGDAFVTKLNAAGTAFVYSTYLGGSGSDFGNGFAIDSSGNAYVFGNTTSTNFPTVNALQSTSNGGESDAFVTKLNAVGNALIYSTYLGGSQAETGLAIALDSSANAYLAGRTTSTNFPRVNGIQSTAAGGGDAFVTKLNPAGTALVYSTYLGGSANDDPGGIAVDSSGSAYITGVTSSTNFPTANALQGALSGVNDAFITKLNPAGTAFAYSTYLGGTSSDRGEAIAVDASGNAYVTGGTGSMNFPTVIAIQGSPGGSGDAFVTKLNASGSALVYSTYIGGAAADNALGIAVEPTGEVHVTGRTNSANFPTANPFQSMIAGITDGFVTKLNAAGNAFITSSYLGGSDVDDARGITFDGSGNVYVTGNTHSSNFPTADPLQSAYAGDPSGNFGDAFILKLNPTSPPARLLNISTRLRVGTGENALIGGFIITGSEPKKVIIRAIGPSLAGQGVAGVLENPTLELVDDTGAPITSNDNWRSTQQAEIEATGVPPSNDAESAIVRTLSPGNYTAVVRGHSGGTGIGLVEVYDLSLAAHSKLANISSRGFVETGENVMIGGFIIGGASGNARVLIRAIGPSLNAAGVEGALQDPTLQLVDGNGVAVQANDNWKSNQQAEIEGTGVPPTNDAESALVATLPPGNYTAVVRGVAGGTGVGLVEVYNIQQ